MGERLRIVHVAESFAGGTFDFISNLLANIPDQEYFIIHGVRKDTPANYEQQFCRQVKFYRWQKVCREISLQNDYLALFELIDLLKTIGKVDVLHLHSSKAGFLGRAAARILGISEKVIYTSHGVSFLRKDISLMKKMMFIGLEQFAAILGGKIVACSASEAAVFRKYYIKNVCNINNGICRIKEDTVSGERKHTFTVATVGRICIQKNPKMFNKIAKHFCKNKEIRFLWIGDGGLRSELYSSNIEITGWLQGENVLAVLKESDVYLSTSLWEGLSLGVLQAMALKKPLLLSNCVGNRDAVFEQSNGYLFEDYHEAIEQIERFRHNPNRCVVCGENSFAIYNKCFTIENMSKQYLEAYREIVNK